VPLSSGATSLAWGSAGGADGAAVVRIVAPEMEEATPIEGVVTMERDGYVLTTTFADDEVSYRLTQAAPDGTEQVLLEIDGRVFFESERVVLGDEGDLTILDEAGTALVTFTEAEATAAYSEAFPDEMVEGDGDLMPVQVFELLHTRDGRTWTVLDRVEAGGAEGAMFSPLAVAVNGDRVVWVTERWSESGEMSPEYGTQTRIYDVPQG
jgi:hypothetical protein